MKAQLEGIWCFIQIPTASMYQERTHWSQNCCVKRWLLKYKDLKVVSLPALMNFPITKKFWKIFLFQAWS